MCSNYLPVTAADRLLTFFGIDKERPGGPLPAQDVFPHGLAPMIRLSYPDDSSATRERVIDDALFRFVPEFVATQVWAKNTFNARSEEVSTKRTYKAAWAAGQRCIIPAECFYEPRYFGTVEKPGPSQRCRIQQPGGVPLGIAGIYRTYTHPVTGETLFAMSMLTVNAEGHPVTHQFHRPGDEKRMPVILDPAEYSMWLSCTPDEAQAMCDQWHGALDVTAVDRPPRAPRAAAGRVVRPPPPPEEPTLF